MVLSVLKRFLHILKHIFFGTYARGFFTSYLLAILIGAAFLKLPVSLQSGVSLAWTDALFTAASALSVTGLSTIVIKDVFTTFGLFVMLFIIQFGGIGLIMMVALFWLVARRKIGFKQRNMIVTDQNQLSRQGIVRFIRNVLIMIFTIEVIAFLIISNYLYLAGYFAYPEALMQGVFLTISLFTNAGFDIAPGADSFQMFASDYVMQFIGMSLIFLGGVGFWVLAEVREFIAAKIHREKFKFSLFVRMIISLHVFFWIFGAIVIALFEWNGFLADKGATQSVFYSLFMSLTTRNAGFSTMDINDFSATTRLFLMVLMFVGASPNSVGGGVRTTTVLIVLMSMKAFMFGREHVVTRGRMIKEETVKKSFVAVIAGVFVIGTGLFILSLSEVQPLPHIAFEVTSAFGTTGLSTGVTPNLSVLGKMTLVMIMFIGRLGILALLLMFRPQRQSVRAATYPEIDVIVG